MVYLKKNLVIFLAVLFTAVLFSPSAFASSSGWEKPDGTAPYGVTSDGDAYGTKLYGALSIALPSLDLSGEGAVSYILRLRNKKNIQLFHGEVGVFHHLDIEGIQAAVMGAASGVILNAFGFDATATLQLKSVDEFMDDVEEGDDGYGGTIPVAAYAMMDVVFAVK